MLTMHSDAPTDILALPVVVDSLLYKLEFAHMWAHQLTHLKTGEIGQGPHQQDQLPWCEGAAPTPVKVKGCSERGMSEFACKCPREVL